MATRKCSECGKALEGKIATARTCGAKHRAARGRRLKRQLKQTQAKGRAKYHPPHHEELSMAERKDAAAQVLKEELRPVAREAIDDDVLRAIRDLVQLTPRAVAAVAQDLEASDDTVRQKAYGLVMRYTMGNPSVAPAPAGSQPAGLQVTFNVPRPDAPAAQAGPALTIDATAADDAAGRACLECHTVKPEEAFVAGSDRCQDCHDNLNDKVRERFGA